jgi:hypothetical protein
LYDLEVVDQDAQTGSTDKDLEEGGPSELNYNSSEVRLTGDGERKDVRFGA